jgi:Plasmid encoded RepA protein
MASIHDLIVRHGKAGAEDLLRGDRPTLPAKEKEQLKIATAFLASENIDFGTIYTGFCLTGLPHREPKKPTWELHNGPYSLLIEPGSLKERVGFKKYGIPYGAHARLILIYLQSQAIRNDSSVVSLGGSLRGWLEAMGLSIGGKTYDSVREQSRRLSACHMTLGYTTADGRDGTKKTSIVDGILLGPASAGESGQGELFDDTAHLSPDFYSMLKKHPVPIAEAAVAQLRNNSAALDVYVWLAYRLHVLERPLDLSWEQLKQQFGSEYSEVWSFKPKFLNNLKLALAVYPGADVRESKRGVTLHPSMPSVPERRNLRRLK